MADCKEASTRKSPVVVAELWGSSRRTEWGNDEIWKTTDKSSVNKGQNLQSYSKSRFEDQGARQDDTMWGGGSGSFNRRVNSAHGILPKPNRCMADRKNVQGLQDKAERNEPEIGGRERKNEVGFGYDSYEYGRPSNGKYMNGHAGGRNFFSANNGFGSNGGYPFNNHGRRLQNGGDSGCFNCGDIGHIARNCRKGADTRAIGEDGCFKCGEDGHFARECTNTRSGFISKNRLAGGGGYVPREEEDFDVLYQNGISSGINFERCFHRLVRVN